MSEKFLELLNISKTFPGVKALDHVKFDIYPGEVHALVGENGAGKSTLIKILSGVQPPDEGGRIIIEGKEVHLKGPMDAIKRGISVIYQDFSLFSNLTVAENIGINEMIEKNQRILPWKEVNRKAKEALAFLKTDINPQDMVGHLSVAKQQMVAIAASVAQKAKMIIMDEPTSSLSEKEVEELLKICRDLREQGIGIIFVSHKLEELFQLCDRITVIRDGEYIDTKDVADWDNDSLIKAMVGRSLDNQFPKEPGVRSEKPLLEVKNIHRKGVLHNVSFKAYGGEVLGFSGLVGAGRTETMRAIFGADPIDGGEIYIRGEKVDIKNPKDAIRAKVAFLTEDRKGQGLILNESIQNNLILANLKGYQKGLFLSQKDMDSMGEGRINELSIKCPSQEERVGQLSGGNQQKVVIGKWLNTNADIYILDEPTRGIDVGAKVEVYQVINRLVKEGKCVIMVSSEMPEILGMSDRVLVMREGRITGEMSRSTDAFNQESVMKAAWEV